MEGTWAMMFCQESVKVTDESQIGEVRRKAKQLGADVGLSEEVCGKISIIATELATNLARHTTGGEILLRTIDRDGVSCVELLSVDRGPGMSNVSQALEDGFSTGGTAGNGLGAVRRLASEFDIYSARPGGTIVFARIGKMERQQAEEFEWGAASRPAPYETLCGDTWRIATGHGEIAIMVADGLGHGPLAAEAVEGVAGAFEENSFATSAEIFVVADRRTRGTRGAAVAVAQIDMRAGVLKYTGVGNIAGSLRSRQSTAGRGLVSHNGTVGVEMRKVQQFDYELPTAPILVMHSDGLQSRWSLEPYPGLIHRHPAVVATVLWRDFTRGRDDVTVCVVRMNHAAN